MEKEDPLQRIEREEREKKIRQEAGGNLRRIVIILSVVAGVLVIALTTVWIQKSTLVGELTAEKQDLTVQIENLQKDYEDLSSNYDAINAQLDSSREEISLLVENIKKTNATNRAKMRQYEKELGTLRSIMRGYITQIDSLNNLNRELTVAAANARRDAAESRRQNEKLSSKVEALSSKVAEGAVLKARELKLEAFNASDRITDRSSRVVRLMMNLCLLENSLAPKGPVTVYVKVFDPAGTLLLDGTGAALNEEPVTASREVDYEGSELELSIYVNNAGPYRKGVYTAEAYTLQGKIGSAEILLR